MTKDEEETRTSQGPGDPPRKEKLNHRKKRDEGRKSVLNSKADFFPRNFCRCNAEKWHVHVPRSQRSTTTRYPNHHHQKSSCVRNYILYYWKVEGKKLAVRTHTAAKHNNHKEEG